MYNTFCAVYSGLMLIDTHCHLNAADLAKNVEEVLKNARSAGVKCFVVPSFDLVSSRAAIELAETYPDCHALIGIHPNDAKDWSAETEGIFRNFCLQRTGSLKGIGEIGLDYHWRISSPELQKAVFREQIALALEFDLPIVVHSREAESDCLTILRQEGVKKAVFHCFCGDLAVAKEVWAAGYHTSFTGIITYPKAESVRSVLALCPPHRLMIETDAPYLPPQSKRGRVCRPEFLPEIFAKVVESRSVPQEEMADLLWKNSCDFFKISAGRETASHQGV